MSYKNRALTRRSLLGAGAALATSAALSAEQSKPEKNGATLSPASGLGVSILVDALKAVGQDAVALTMSRDIRSLTSQSRTVMGPAVTTKWQTGSGRMTAEDVSRNMFVPLDQASDGSIWIVAGGGGNLVSLFGGIIGAACKRNGLSAAITDNGCRDVETFNDVDFPVFAQGAVPYGPGDTARPVDANVPVMCGGVRVSPGDTVAADADGIVVIPSAVLAEVLDAAKEVLRKEKAVMDRIDDGMKLSEAYDL